jgi:DNA helicase II / ATP-dependent DNA helicase PcrA
MSFTDDLRNNGWSKPTQKNETLIRRFSTTGDILAFKRCQRQYGFFSVRGFSSATATQRYFGTLVHDVLDQVHRQYTTNPALPDQPELEALVQQAHDRLIRSGIRPYNARAQRELATKLIGRFLELIGPHFFPHVQQTEYHLQRALRTHTDRQYVLDGIVDVLSGAVAHDLELSFSTDEDDVEIWDYKSGRRPDKGSVELRDYEYQMQVYAELYRQQTGDYPARAVLVFLGELGDDQRYKDGNKRRGDYIQSLLYIFNPQRKRVEKAMQDFHDTVELIEAEHAKPYADQWLPPAHTVEEQTCEACELRYKCSSFPAGGSQRSEPL